MSEQAFERKKDFVNHALSRCVAAMYPNVCRVAYHIRDTDEGLRETAMLHLAGGLLPAGGRDRPGPAGHTGRRAGGLSGGGVMGRYTGREKRQKILLRLAMAAWVIVLCMVLCLWVRG